MGDKRLLSMKEACSYLGVSRMTLLEAEERGMIRPDRTIGGHRRYTVDALQSLSALRRTDYQRAPAEPAGAAPARAALDLLGAHADCQEQLLREALRSLVLLLQAEIGVVYLSEPGGALALHAAFGVPHWVLRAMARLGRGGLSGRALACGQPLVYSDHALGDFPAQLEIGQGVCVPLRYQEQPLGVLHIITAQSRQLFPSEVMIATTMASYLAVLVMNGRLLPQLRAQLDGRAGEVAEAAALREAYAVAAAGLGVGVGLLSRSFELLRWDAAAERLAGAPAGPLLGADPRPALPALEAAWAALAQSFADGLPRHGQLPGCALWYVARLVAGGEGGPAYGALYLARAEISVCP